MGEAKRQRMELACGAYMKRIWSLQESPGTLNPETPELPDRPQKGMAGQLDVHFSGVQKPNWPRVYIKKKKVFLVKASSHPLRNWSSVATGLEYLRRHDDEWSSFITNHIRGLVWRNKNSSNILLTFKETSFSYSVSLNNTK